MIKTIVWRRSFAIPAIKSALVLLLTFGSAVVLYARTAAPSVLSGDSGEFQFAAPLLAVPHPTGYPLYTILGKLATLLPIGDMAHRVTLVSAVAGAGTVALVALLVWWMTERLLAGLIAAVALTVAPGLWHLSTIAEVYTLNTLLLAGLGLTLWHAWSRAQSHHRPKWLYAAACITGLGVSHHGSFAFIGAPLLFGFGILPVIRQAIAERQTVRDAIAPVVRSLLPFAGFSLLGLIPWLFVFVQYARLGPFEGIDHGWPRAYFWGAPTTWNAALSHVVGGTMRSGVFDLPGPRTLVHTVLGLWERLQFEFGPLGVTLGVIGGYTLLCRPIWVGLGTAWVIGITTLYVASLGSAVQDAPVFTLPILLPWAIWVGVGADALAKRTVSLWKKHHQFIITGVLLGLFILMLAWGQTRLPYGNKADQWLFRTFGEGALTHMAPDAVVLTRWEQGTILQYLRLIEGQRPDVWVDIVEMEDDPWRERAERRYPDQSVYLIGSAEEGADLGATYVWGTDYASLFRLQPEHN